MKPVSTAQAQLMRMSRGNPKAPTTRKPAPALRELSPLERLQEREEERRHANGWRERKPPIKGYGGA